MLTAANAEACAQPHWRVIAAGFDTERWFADNQAVGTAGIANPQPTRLPAGQYDYRFTSSRSNSRASTDDVGSTAFEPGGFSPRPPSPRWRTCPAVVTARLGTSSIGGWTRSRVEGIMYNSCRSLASP